MEKEKGKEEGTKKIYLQPGGRFMIKQMGGGGGHRRTNTRPSAGKESNRDKGVLTWGKRDGG